MLSRRKFLAAAIIGSILMLTLLTFQGANAILRPDAGHLLVTNALSQTASGACAGTHSVGYSLRTTDYPHKINVHINADCSISVGWQWPTLAQPLSLFATHTIIASDIVQWHNPLTGQSINDEVTTTTTFQSSPLWCTPIPSGAAGNSILMDVVEGPTEDTDGCYASYFTQYQCKQARCPDMIVERLNHTVATSYSTSTAWCITGWDLDGPNNEWYEPSSSCTRRSATSGPIEYLTEFIVGASVPIGQERDYVVPAYGS